jgi:2-phospho-L-lactate transferase/gluconeogenesis factor (CofD/UPF0052 family)
MINIVSFNGGRGARNLIPSFVIKEGITLTSIVNAYDDGKSTGILRSFFKMLGPSDIRKVQETLVPKSLQDYDAIIKLYEYRYPISLDRQTILTEIENFVTGVTDLLVGVTFKDAIIKNTLKHYLQKFVKGVHIIETAENKVLSFADCSIMNLIYAGAFLSANGNFEEATINIGKLFKIRGNVLTTNIEDKKLVAIREDGSILYNEAEIVELRSNVRIKKIYLLDSYPDKKIIETMKMEEVEEYFETMNRQVAITPKVQRSITDADIIIYSSGTQHSSLYPSYMTMGLTDAIAANKKAFKIFVTNIGEDYETPSYTATDFLQGAIKYLRLGSQFNIAVNDIINVALVNKLFSNNEENYVKYDATELEKIGCKIIIDDFEDTENPGKHNGPFLCDYIMDLYAKYNTK